MEEEKDKARRILRQLRNGAALYEYFLRCLRISCETGGFTLHDIGTDEEELKAILVNGFKRDAMVFLEALRHGSYLYEKTIVYLRIAMKGGNFTLETLGSSEEELERLRVKGCKTAALLYLGELRSPILSHNRESEAMMREELKKGGLTLEDIGMNEKQVAALLNSSHTRSKREAEKVLRLLRSGTTHADDYVDYLLGELSRGNLMLDDIGTTREEIESFRTPKPKR